MIRSIRRRLRGFGYAVLGLTVWAGALGGAPPVAAEPTVRFDVMVSQISAQPGAIDPRAKSLHEKLRREFRYESLRVLEEATMKLGIDEVGRLQLPNGKRLGLKPLLIDNRGVLLAVDIDGAMQGDLRVKKGHQVVIGAQRYEQGKLVISLIPRF